MIILLGESVYNLINPKLAKFVGAAPSNCIINKSFATYKDIDIDRIKHPPLFYKGWVLITQYQEKKVLKVLKQIDYSQNVIIIQCNNLNDLNTAINELNNYNPTVFNNFKIPVELKRAYIKKSLNCNDTVVQKVLQASGNSLYILNRNIDYLKSLYMITSTSLKNLFRVDYLHSVDFIILLLQRKLSNKQKTKMFDFLYKHSYYYIGDIKDEFDEVYELCRNIELNTVTYDNYKEYKSDLFTSHIYTILNLMETVSYDDITKVYMFVKSLDVNKTDYIKLIMYVKEKRID